MAVGLMDIYNASGVAIGRVVVTDWRMDEWDLPLCRLRCCVGSFFRGGFCLVRRCRRTPCWSGTRSRCCRSSRPTSRRAHWRRRRRGRGAARGPRASSRRCTTRWHPPRTRATPRASRPRSLSRRWTLSPDNLQQMRMTLASSNVICPTVLLVMSC